MAHSPESLVGADIIRPRAIGDRPYNSICPVRTPYRIEDALHCGTAATSLQRNFTLHSFPPAHQAEDLLLTFFLDRCIVARLRFLERGDFFAFSGAFSSSGKILPCFCQVEPSEPARRTIGRCAGCRFFSYPDLCLRAESVPPMASVPAACRRSCHRCPVPLLQNVRQPGRQ